MNFMKQYRICLRNCAVTPEKENIQYSRKNGKKQRISAILYMELLWSPLHLEKIPEREQNFWNKYLDQLEHFHYEEEQRAYYQGMMDVVEFLINIGAIKKSTNVKRMIEKYAR